MVGRNRQSLLSPRPSANVTSSGSQSVGRSASDVREMTLSPQAAGYTVLFPEVFGVHRQERFPVRLVRGVDVLPAVLHDVCRRVISVALDLHSVV